MCEFESGKANDRDIKQKTLPALAKTAWVKSRRAFIESHGTVKRKRIKVQPSRLGVLPRPLSARLNLYNVQALYAWSLDLLLAGPWPLWQERHVHRRFAHSQHCKRPLRLRSAPAKFKACAASSPRTPASPLRASKNSPDEQYPAKVLQPN